METSRKWLENLYREGTETRQGRTWINGLYWNSQLSGIKDKFTKVIFYHLVEMVRQRLITSLTVHILRDTIKWQRYPMLVISWIKYISFFFVFCLSRQRQTSCSSSRIRSAKTARSPRPHVRNAVESSWGDLGPHLLGPRNANQHFVLFHNPGCKEGILPQVRGILVRGVYSVDRSHFVHSSVDGNHYWVHVHDSRYSNGPFTCRLWQ